jgi:hypothetical protein
MSDTNEIKRIVEEIHSSKKLNKEEYFGEKYPDFKTTNPVMFQVACEGKMNLSRLNYMINMIDQIKNSQITQDEASVDVGQMLYKEYVEPKVSKMKFKENQ